MMPPPIPPHRLTICPQRGLRTSSLLHSRFLPFRPKRPLQQIHRPPQSPKYVPQPKAPPPNPHRIDKEIHQRPVAAAKGQENAEILPLVARHDVKSSHILGAVLIRAVAAVARCRRVGEVASSRALHERRRVLRARLAGRGVEKGGLARGADDGDGRQGGGHDAADPVGGGDEVVKPVAPEGGHEGVRADDAVEESEHDEEEG